MQKQQTKDTRSCTTVKLQQNKLACWVAHPKKRKNKRNRRNRVVSNPLFQVEEVLDVRLQHIDHLRSGKRAGRRRITHSTQINSTPHNGKKKKEKTGGGADEQDKDLILNKAGRGGRGRAAGRVIVEDISVPTSRAACAWFGGNNSSTGVGTTNEHHKPEGTDR